MITMFSFKLACLLFLRLIQKCLTYAVVLVLGLVLVGCFGNESTTPNLNKLPLTATPDEFRVLPSKPLQYPNNYTVLPPPNPHASNRAAPAPIADAIVALGGRADAAVTQTIPPQDTDLYRYAEQYNTQDDIRALLAAEDLAFRQRNQGQYLERLFNQSNYLRAYRPFALDKYRALALAREQGIRNVAAPPKPKGKS